MSNNFKLLSAFPKLSSEFIPGKKEHTTLNMKMRRLLTLMPRNSVYSVLKRVENNKQLDNLLHILKLN